MSSESNESLYDDHADILVMHPQQTALRRLLRGGLYVLLGTGVIGSAVGLTKYTVSLLQGTKTEFSTEKSFRFDQIGEGTEEGPDLIGRKMRIIVRTPEGNRETIARFVRQGKKILLEVDERLYRCSSPYAKLVTGAKYNSADNEVELTSDTSGTVRFGRGEYESVIAALHNNRGPVVTVNVNGVYEGIGIQLEGILPLTFELEK